MRAKTSKTWAVSTELDPSTVPYSGVPPRLSRCPTSNRMPAAALASPPPVRTRFDDDITFLLSSEVLRHRQVAVPDRTRHSVPTSYDPVQRRTDQERQEP